MWCKIKGFLDLSHKKFIEWVSQVQNSYLELWKYLASMPSAYLLVY